jgi:hypothetical protein
MGIGVACSEEEIGLYLLTIEPRICPGFTLSLLTTLTLGHKCFTGSDSVLHITLKKQDRGAIVST